MRETHNKALPFIKQDWSGNPLDLKGRYANLAEPSYRSSKDVFRWKFLDRNPFAAQKKDQKTNVEVIKINLPSKTEDSIVWLGHATFLITIDGLRMITDPILYDIWPLRRFTALPIAIDSLIGIDIILLSHNHRDHADKKSMQKITKLNPQAVIYTGLQIDGLLRGWDIDNQVTTAGWYQSYPTIKEGLQIDYLPAKHWCRRWLHDLNEMLWGSFMISTNDKTIYFGADSGMGQHFDTIGSMYSIDVAMIGIGAYEPKWFMSGSHTSPEDALHVKRILGAKRMIPMHYGTFDLSDEPIDNPKSELIKYSNNDANSKPLDIGQVLSF